MQDRAQEQSQSVDSAAYPQLCGSWSSDDWPEDELIDQYRSFVEFCAGLHVEYGSMSEDGSIKSPDLW